MNKLSIIIPVYYNADTLSLLYEDIKKVIFDKVPACEVIMVDDGSGDDSWKIMNELSERDERIKLIRLSRNFGSHAAILAGLLNCSGDCAAIKAADLQEDSELIIEMYESWLMGNKVVLMARNDRDEKASQKFFANLYYGIVRKLISPQMPKGGFDCYLIDKKVIEVLRLLDEKNSAVTLQILWAGFQTDVIYYVRKKREIGKSRWTMRKKIKLVVDSVMSFSYFPVRFMSGVGVIFFGVSIIWAIFIFVNKLVNGIDAAGWTTLMIMLLFTSGLMMLMLGILGEYIWRSLDASRNRPPYIIDEMKNENKF